MKFEQEMQTIASYADGTLIAGRIDRIGVLMFNQPEKRNAVSLEMWEGVCAALDLFAAAPEIAVVVYAGAGGKAFSSGNDISQFATRRNSAEANAAYAGITGRGRDKLDAFPKPSIACIQGYCMGGGVGLALQADLRVAGADAVFGIPAARLGIAFGIEPAERLVALVGPGRAKLILYTARKFTAAEAFALGLIEVLATVDPVRETIDLARTIAENAPLSVAAIKFSIEQAQSNRAERDHVGMAEHTKRCIESADYGEARKAFQEKRKPLFVGA